MTPRKESLFEYLSHSWNHSQLVLNKEAMTSRSKQPTHQQHEMDAQRKKALQNRGSLPWAGALANTFPVSFFPIATPGG